ncbi:MAG TPA: SRPBCC domain-containing protein [Ktedonobacterales bacterium]
MRVEGTQIFPGAKSIVFAALTNPDALARAIPGCERFIQFGPATADGQVAYEARLRLGPLRQPYVVTARVATARRPDYLRLDLSGFGPSGPLTGDGSLDLVTQDDHTVVAYRLSVTGPDLPESADGVPTSGTFIARTAFAHLADELHATSGASAAQYAASTLAADAARLNLVSSDVPSWGERAVWMGAGLGLGLGAIALAVAVVRRLGGTGSGK